MYLARLKNDPKAPWHHVAKITSLKEQTGYALCRMSLDSSYRIWGDSRGLLMERAKGEEVCPRCLASLQTGTRP